MEPPQTATVARHATRAHRYTLAQVVASTGVPEVRVQRWIKAGIIQPVGGGGAQGIRREFSLRNLVEIVCCHHLHWMGVTEPARQAFVLLLQSVWTQPTLPLSNLDPTGLTFRDAPFLWFSCQLVLLDDTWQETLTLQPCDLPMVAQLLTGDLGPTLPPQPQSGLVLPLAHIIRELEARTGDVLVWG